MRIAVINTGGTISCVGDPLAPMTAEEFAKASETHINPIVQQRFPSIQVTYLTNVPFPESKTKTLDSTNLQPTDWCIMAKAILENYADFDGFVVLHGTDSMDFTGAALPFLLNSFDVNGYGTAVLSKPIVITGSQVPMYYQASGSADVNLNYNTDAYQNFCGAIACARTGVPEVCVYFQNRLYRGSRVVKTNASEFNAFSSPNYPPLAEYGVELLLLDENWLPGPVHDDVSLDDASVRAAQQAAVEEVRGNVDDVPVMQFNAFPAEYRMSDGSTSPATAFVADLFDSAVNAGAKGIILESYGEGNFPSGNPDHPAEGAIYQALKAANTSGINIVDCTQVLSGTVNDIAYAAGAWLPDVGALSPADLSPIAALAKLIILMASATQKGWTRQHIRFLFQTDLTGEMQSVNSLDSRGNAVLLPGQQISTTDGSATLTNDPALGPVLMGIGNPSPLWSLPSPPPAKDLAGRLVMQGDGNLVLYGRSGKALWATDTGNPAGASSKLTLTGTYDANVPANGDVLLQVYDYSDMRVARVIYAQEKEARAISA